jgi:CRISPR-associated protein Cmx8
MARTQAKASVIASVTVEYDLFDLPTAQHKAGLAGLILHIRDMEQRAKKGAKITSVPAIAELTPVSAKITFTQESVQALMDEVYAAEIVEVSVKTKWQGRAPKREDEIEEVDEGGKAKKVKRFVYDVVQPAGHYLRSQFNDDRSSWLKLWREMLWAIPRGIPKTRIPFEQRAEAKCCTEGIAAWADLVRVEQARKKNGFYTAEVGSALWLGAQATNAELLPFKGRAEQNLLLHFWPLTTLIFVPQQITIKYEDDQLKVENEFVGYVLAIPEVADLETFLVDYPQLLGQLGRDVRGYRPAEAVIDLPAQGALAFLEHLARLSSEKAADKVRYSIGSVDFLHLAKFGNNIKSLAAGRVAPYPGLLASYQAIVGYPGQPAPFRNPLFRRGLMLALLNDEEWHEPFDSMLAEQPWPLFIRSERSPKTLPWFWQDAALKFEDLVHQFSEERREHEEMVKDATDQGAAAPQAPLPLLIHRLVQNYVLRKTEEKSGQKWDEFKNKKVKDEKTGRERIDVPQAYREAKERIASGVFLEMRSRREQDFVDHFTATFCSVRQYLPEDDFRVVAQALLEKPDNVKTLTLLALSASS